MADPADDLRHAPDRAGLFLFLAVAFGGAWGLPAVAYLAGVRLNSTTAIAIGVPCMLFPALGAWLAERRRGAAIVQSLDVRLRPNGWWLAGWIAPLPICLLAFAIALLLPGVTMLHDASAIPDRFAASLKPEQLAAIKTKLAGHSVWLILAAGSLQALLAGATINAAAALGEEIGWRGYLQRAVAPLGFWKGSAVVGLVWGPWHAALVVQGYNYPEHPLLGAFLMIPLTVLLSPLLAAVRIHGRSVVASAVAHGSFNACGGFAILLVRGGSDLTVGVTGLAGLLSLALANLVLFAVLRRRPAS